MPGYELVNCSGKTVDRTAIESFRNAFRGGLVRAGDAEYEQRAADLERQHRQASRADRALHAGWRT